ncbi:MAG: hypothetical protein AAFV88_05095 [Planctomycetota bacterium]
MRSSSLFGRLLTTLVIGSALAGSVDAGWNEFWQKVGIGYERNNAWPEPFNELDAMGVITPFEIQKRNGWILHNTIGPHQFRPSDGALTISGQEALAWIAREAPASRRQVYVVHGANKDETQSRLTAVRDMLAQMEYHGPQPEVFLTSRTPPTAPGGWATKINRAWLDELAPPKLPSTSSSGTNSATRN